MRLLECSSDGKFILTKDFIDGDEVTQYAILSHTWVEGEEVTFDDLSNGSGKDKLGYEKIRFCAEQARQDGLRYCWVDTCCINKANFTELSQAINSMFYWYHNATKCYVYLADVSTAEPDANDQSSGLPFETAFRASRWFTRGWTLQELLAPSSVEFFSREYKKLGDKGVLERQICEITGIPEQALRGTPLPSFGVDERMSWAKNRNTTYKEDEAYSLLGIFDIHMPLIYGEGRDNALLRLREEIDKPSKEFNRLPYVAEASFNSYAKQHQPICLPDTRVDLLEMIYEWADADDDRCIFWLSGLAGTGKSTIARTVARKYFEKKRLGANFFFSRGGGDVSHAGKFCTTVAVQLANHIPTLRRHVCDAISTYNDISSLSLDDQWRQLVLGPLSKLGGNNCPSSYILVIDALDECDDNKNIRIILQLLGEVRLLKRVRLRIFLTSRPEVPIRYGYSQLPENERYNIILHNISPSVIEHDISVFLEHHLKFIGEEHAEDVGWPGANAIQTLVNNAGGLFIWAATACRFINDGLFADERLRMLLQGGISATDTPEDHLNEIYITVLRSSIRPTFSQQDKERFCGILRSILGSSVALFSPLPVNSLSRLLDIPKQRVDQILKGLHAIIDIPEDPIHPLRLHHPSFRDFLFNKERCRDSNFSVDETQVHKTLLESCIQLLSTYLKQDICGLSAPGVLATDLDSSRLRLYLPPEVQYACLYWVEHLYRSNKEIYEDDQIHQFLQMHFLHWLEALSWMRRLPEAIRATMRFLDMTFMSSSPSLSAFIYDMNRFALYGKSAIEQAPLQAYCSALIFAPTNSVVKKQFQNRVPRLIRRWSKVQEYWSDSLMTLEGHTNWVLSVRFSPDGGLLASASRDKTVRLWEPDTGAVLNTLRGHTARVNSVAFCFDGTVLASASSDYTIKLWDTATGAVLETLEGHTYWVNSVAFSYSGLLLASASSDTTIRLWDLGTRATLMILDGHIDWVRMVVFSPNRDLLASASKDMTIRLWDPITGAVLNILKGHQSAVNSVAFLYNDSRLSSASSDDTVRLWDIATGATLFIFKGHTDWVRSVAYSDDKKLLVSASSDTIIRLWDTNKGVAINSLEGHTGGVRSIAFSPLGKLLASASTDTTIRIWKTNEIITQDITTFRGHTNWVNDVAFSPDGAMLASASSDTTVKLWNVATFTSLKTLEGHEDWVKSVVFSNDGALLASTSDDRTVRLWNVATGAPLKTITVHPTVQHIAFSSDGQFLETDLGPLEIVGLESLHPRNISPPKPLPGTPLLLEEHWVVRGSEKFLWLPPEYRGRCWAASGNVIAIGHQDGRVTFIEFG